MRISKRRIIIILLIIVSASLRIYDVKFTKFVGTWYSKEYGTIDITQSKSKSTYDIKVTGNNSQEFQKFVAFLQSNGMIIKDNKLKFIGFLVDDVIEIDTVAGNEVNPDKFVNYSIHLTIKDKILYLKSTEANWIYSKK